MGFWSVNKGFWSVNKGLWSVNMAFDRSIWDFDWSIWDFDRSIRDFDWSIRDLIGQYGIWLVNMGFDWSIRDLILTAVNFNISPPTLPGWLWRSAPCSWWSSECPAVAWRAGCRGRASGSDWTSRWVHRHRGRWLRWPGNDTWHLQSIEIAWINYLLKVQNDYWKRSGRV